MLTNLWKILAIKESTFKVKLASKTHDVFKAHFPNNPLLPGFVIIEICSTILNHDIKEIKKAKFINKAYPNDTLCFEYKNQGNIISLHVKKEDIKIAEIIYEHI